MSKVLVSLLGGFHPSQSPWDLRPSLGSSSHASRLARGLIAIWNLLMIPRSGTCCCNNENPTQNMIIGKRLISEPWFCRLRRGIKKHCYAHIYIYIYIYIYIHTYIYIYTCRYRHRCVLRWNNDLRPTVGLIWKSIGFNRRMIMWGGFHIYAYLLEGIYTLLQSNTSHLKNVYSHSLCNNQAVANSE